MTTRRSLLAAAGAVAAPSLSQAQNSRVLRFVPQADVGVLDPIWTGAYVSRNHGGLIFDTLYALDSRFQIQPQMAEGHSIENDGRQWSIRLREGLRWQDGEAVLARDAVASIRRWAARDSFGDSLIAATDELSAPDDRTIRFRLKRPFPLLSYALGKPGSPQAFIMPERIASTDPYRQITELVGSGPFRFNAAERVPGARLVYERNQHYRPRENGTPDFLAGPKIVHVDRVEWQVLPDASTAAAALQRGEVDWWEAPGFDLLPLLERNRHIRVSVLDPTGSILVLRFNQAQAPFNNPAIRRAVLPALSQADYVLAASGENPDYWRTGVGVFPPGTPLASDAGLEALTAPRDLDQAKRALEQAGYRGERVVVLVPTDLPVLKAEGEVGADLFRRIGFNVDFQAQDWGTTQQRLAKRDPVDQGGWSYFHTTWAGADQLNPGLHQYLRGNGATGRTGWPESPRIEELRSAWLEAPDEAAQQRLGAELQRQALHDLPYIPLGQVLPRTAHRRNVTDILAGGYPVFWNLKKA
ncbi:ABC transporter substrate-binding protein [Rhodovarius crocodyli]|uniref:ABC transporter substrate-binding protein n=1 Tax=Rhodovarius crocodyli TaxID=1979269 RepID=A0A437M229_9PROT|nr:ABC transporter substrate-binding protein [Rhodovarius crocodyli]RVT91636.1 ABC transporter substrate-binding protein [Rhodovarius crocodyli]